MFPDCSIISASFENVEKVVKPPQSPTVRNKAQLLPSLAVRLNRPHKSPIRKQPTRFTISVAQGNPLLAPFIISETRYLAAPPMKLPAPTTAIFLMMSETIEFRFSEAKLHIFGDMLAYLSRLVPADHLEDYSYLCSRRSDARLLLLTPGAVLQQCMTAPFDFCPPDTVFLSPTGRTLKKRFVPLKIWGTIGGQM